MLTDEFLIALKQKYIDTISQYNQERTLETKKWDFANKAGKAEVNVSRGKVFEKACVSTISATVTIPGRDYQSSIQWLGIQTFPANPLVPLFMGVFEHVSEQGVEHSPGFYDIYPVIAYDEDKEYVKKKWKQFQGSTVSHTKIYLRATKRCSRLKKQAQALAMVRVWHSVPRKVILSTSMTLPLRYSRCISIL